MPEKKITQLREIISDIEANPMNSLSSQSFQMEFLRHHQMDFMELIKTSSKSLAEYVSGELDARLRQEFTRNALSEEYTDMLKFRQILPSFRHRDEIVDSVKKNGIVLISGNTGCGKTTQVAQYILDDALINMEGGKTKILCTQPRRIAG